MAGVIVFKSSDWYSSSGAFRAMAEGVNRHLSPAQAASVVRDLISVAVESQLYYLDTQTFTDEMLREFKTAVELHIAEASAADASPSENPELHAGYLARLNQLQQSINNALTE